MIRIEFARYYDLIANCSYEMNIGQIKKYRDASDILEDDAKKIVRFREVFDFTSFLLLSTNSRKCNVCRTDVMKCMNLFESVFKIYICNFCNSVFFYQDEFDAALRYAAYRSDHYSFFEKIKRFFKKISF